MRSVALNRWMLIIYGLGAIFLKSLILDGYIANPPYIVPDVRAAVDYRIPSLTIYLCFVAILVAPSFLLKNKGHYWYLVLLNLVVSSIFLMDLWYYRAFARFTSFHHLHEGANFKNLSPALFSFVHASDFLLLADALTLIFVLVYAKIWPSFRPSFLAFLLLFGLPAGYLIHVNSAREINAAPLFAFRPIPLETVSTLSPLGYHFYDMIAYLSERKQIELAPAERNEVKAWFAANRENLPPNNYKGLFRGCNLILLQSESLENFVIRKKYNGQELTPNLNRILSSSLYFPDFMEQVADGTSSDAEFMANTSIYPLQRGSVSWRYPQNSYHSLPRMLEKLGYWSVDMHPDAGSYWNWSQMMTGVGMKQCLDAGRFVQDEMIELGLSDGSFLRQTVPILAKTRQPFYAYLVTQTNHCPYDLPARYRELRLDPKFDQSEIGGYLQGVRYADRNIGAFLSDLDAAGLLDNTAIVIFGDHCGIHKFSKEALARIPEREQRWMENGERIPLILYKKGVAGEDVDVIGGEIDILPTVAYLMGVDESEFGGFAMGRNLLNTRKSFAILNDGEFIASHNDEREKKHALKGIEVADKVLRSNFYKEK